MVVIPALFETAFAHHHAGRVAEAVALYQQVLQSDPRHSDALHLLGVAVHQLGKHEQAVEYLNQAIALDGGNSEYHANLGEVYLVLSRPDEAIRCYRQASRLDPASAQAHLRLADAYRMQGQVELAEAEYREALRLRPEYPDALDRLGQLLHERGDTVGAIARFEHALQSNPKLLHTYSRLATALADVERFDEAVECYRRGARHLPEASEFPFGMGVIEQRRKRYEAAERHYREAVRLNPRFAMALNNLGTVLKELGRLDEALACFGEALAIDPRMSAPYCNIGGVFVAQKRFDEAIEAYRGALERDPSDTRSLISYGGVLERRGKIDEALACYQRVVQLRPDSAVGHWSCANVYRHLRRLPEAMAAYQQALRLKPDYIEAYSNMAIMLLEAAQVDAAERCARKGLELAPQNAALMSHLATALLLEGRLDEALELRRKSVELAPDKPVEYSNLVYDLNFLPDMDPREIFQEHLAWARRHAEPHAHTILPHANDRNPDRPLRVGYVSAFFRMHAVTYFTEPILTAHDRANVEVYCYSDSISVDDTTDRLRAAATAWRNVYGSTDDELAALVRNDAIDILVDLAGHIGSNRLPMFARKPAPIQVTYIGYQNTTGMAAMDYRLTDAHADPEGETDRYYTEKLVRLPRAFFCYRPPDDAPPVTPLPALERGSVTFGSFNKYVKVTRPTIAAWLRILAQVPSARLLVLAQRGGYAENRLHVAAATKGIDPKRIEFFDQQRHTDLLNLMAQADVALDPFPFNGHTTTCESLWMGVPVVTLLGQSYASRFGSSAHVNLQLESWIARSVDEYVEIAVRAAGELDSLVELRRELRPRMAASPLLDFGGFTRNLETAYREMWRAWCAEEA